MRSSVLPCFLITISVLLSACGSGTSETLSNSPDDVPAFQEGVAIDLVKKALRSIARQQSGCELILRVGGWTERYDGKGIWSVTAKRGNPFRVHELTSRVLERGAGSASHGHSQYSCHPSQST